MRSRGTQTPPDGYRPDHGQVGSDSAGQSGDTQGLSPVVVKADESVEELVENGQSFEAEAVQGVKDADEHPEAPVRTHGPGGAPDVGPAPKGAGE